MVKSTKHETKTVVGIGVNSLGLFFGAFWAIMGLAIAIVHSLRGTISFARETESIVAGLTFGLTAGVVTIIVVPLAYFAIGWVIGALYGVIFNAVAVSSGGIELRLADSAEGKTKK